MLDPIPSSYQQVVAKNQVELQSLVEHGLAKPFFLYHLLIYSCLPLSALLVSGVKGSKYVRFAVFVLILSIAVDAIKYRRTLVASGYIVGLVMSWWAFWCGTLLVFNDVEKDFKRIERRTACFTGGRREQSFADGVKKPVNGHSEVSKWSDFLHEPERPRRPTALRARSSAADLPQQRASEREILVWQSYPQAFLHRLNWSLGLLFNMRGPEWNWRISSLSPLPKPVQAELNPQSSYKPCLTHPIYPNAKVLLKGALLTSIKSYLCLDIAKCVMMRDPYFWGVISPTSPPFPFNLLSRFPILVRLYRLHLTAFGVVSAVTYICSFNPIIFLGLSLAFPNASRSLTATPLDAPWLYANTFGPFIQPVLDHGLAGCWGHWWHQLFRFGFTSPARWVLSLLPAELTSNRQFRRIVYLSLAFLISGFMHSCGSYTHHGDTKPLSGPFLFFISQVLGIMIQNIFSEAIMPRLYPRGMPRWVRRGANFAFAFTWLMGTGSLIADDFAKGGIWLTEPVPVSPLRGIGLAGDGDGWWCWRYPWFRYWSDGTWWQSGVQIL